ncbi:hypothetical protein Ahy_A04g018961 isoform B [Arachis hypogaea]|uniref:Uncharacterized protein n=1 Tax=Arachis hypogaea TaxID=3818 RepID=A0A445DF12_ARAHY|nr:hypothetical protein Ahy_A04g018961 isoform B [Arachis hypogaea]
MLISLRRQKVVSELLVALPSLPSSSSPDLSSSSSSDLSSSSSVHSCCSPVFCSPVLPLAQKHFSIKRQCELLYQSLCIMPLKLIKCVLPWLIGSLTKDLKNISSNRICCSHTTFVVGLARLITMVCVCLQVH